MTPEEVTTLEHMHIWAQKMAEEAQQYYTYFWNVPSNHDYTRVLIACTRVNTAVRELAERTEKLL